MSRSPVIAAICASLLLQGCTHVRGYQQVATTPAVDDGSAAESPAPPLAPAACSIAPSVMGGMAKGLLVPLIICLSGGSFTLLLCGAALEEAAGVAAGVIFGSMSVGGLIGAAYGASQCLPTPAVAEPDAPAPGAAPEPAAPPAEEPPSPDPSPL